MSTIEPQVLVSGNRGLASHNFPVVPSPWADFSQPWNSLESERGAGWDEVIRKLGSMLFLKNDWDGMGAVAPICDIVYSAFELAYTLKRAPGYPPPARVLAGPDGAITMEWQESSVYTEVEVSAPDQFEWMRVRDGWPAEHWTDDQPPDIDEWPEDTTQSDWQALQLAERTRYQGRVRILSRRFFNPSALTRG
jgi:hypothetical protein